MNPVGWRRVPVHLEKSEEGEAELLAAGGKMLEGPAGAPVLNLT